MADLLAGPLVGGRSTRQQIALTIARRPETWACALYALLVGAVALRHEPWADEAQAWLIARDAGLVNLWAHLLRLEGSPGLWHSLLYLLIHLHVPYTDLNLVSTLLGAAAAVVLTFRSPFLLAIRLLLPFTYFLCYQYAVVARSYALAPVLLFLIATLYPSAYRRVWVTLALLVALATVSVHGFLVSAAIAFTLAVGYLGQRSQFGPDERRRILLAASLYLAAALLIAYAVWPYKDAVFVAAPNWSLANFIGMSRYAFQQGFGADYLPVMIIGLSLPTLWRTPGLPFFAVSALSLCVFGAAIYSNVWHHGFLVLSWLFAVWIAFPSTKLRWPGIAALALFLAVQCPWTWNAVRYDWTQPYSGSKAAAQYLKQQNLPQSRVFAIGFPTVAVQPYFQQNVFSNYTADHGRDSFWLWSKQNTTNDASEKLSSDRADFVLLGYAGDSDRKLWSHLILASGFQSVRQFAGNTFWRTGPFQPETYELFRRGPSPTDARLSSALDFRSGLGAASDQLLWGFADHSKGKEQWLGTSSSVALQRPAAPERGAQLTVDFAVPEETIRKAGCYTFRAYVSGASLTPESVCRAGSYHYVRPVAARDLFWAVVPVAFVFRKSGFVLNDSPQERFAVIQRIGLAAR